jgi:hypothetical protein
MKINAPEGLFGGFFSEIIVAPRRRNDKIFPQQPARHPQLPV